VSSANRLTRSDRQHLDNSCAAPDVTILPGQTYWRWEAADKSAGGAPQKTSTKLLLWIYDDDGTSDTLKLEMGTDRFATVTTATRVAPAAWLAREVTAGDRTHWLSLTNRSQQARVLAGFRRDDGNMTSPECFDVPNGERHLVLPGESHFVRIDDRGAANTETARLFVYEFFATGVCEGGAMAIPLLATAAKPSFR
jgi:hypothetical protein